MSTTDFVDFLTNPTDLDDEPIPALHGTTMGTLSLYPSHDLGGRWHAVARVVADGTPYCRRPARPDTTAVPVTVRSPDADTVMLDPADWAKVCHRCVDLWLDNRWT